MAHPFRGIFEFKVRKYLSDILAQKRKWRLRRTSFGSTELHDTSRAHPPFHRRDRKFALCDHHRAFELNIWAMKFNVIAAFAFNRHLNAQAFRKRLRPDTGGDNEAIRRNVALIGLGRSRLPVLAAKTRQCRSRDRAALRFKMRGEL